MMRKILLPIRIEFKPQDCWIGVYWKKEFILEEKNWWRCNAWICLLPMLPIHIWFGNSPWKKEKFTIEELIERDKEMRKL